MEDFDAFLESGFNEKNGNNSNNQSNVRIVVVNEDALKRILWDGCMCNDGIDEFLDGHRCARALLSPTPCKGRFLRDGFRSIPRCSG